MKLQLCILCVLGGAVFLSLGAQAVDFTSSNLPIVIIDTQGQNIRNEPKITAHMSIIYNGPGKRNHMTDAPNHYDGYIGIEYRGDSSLQFDKKQFAIETRDSLGANLNLSLFGMPRENDWVLYAPYSDKSLMRNVLAYKLSADLGHYASRTQFCEVVLNGEYWGIYVFMEKIKRDKGRIAIADLDSTEVDSPDVTGGYILKVDKSAGGNVGGWFSDFPLFYEGGRGRIYYQYHFPKPDEITPPQKEYIQQFMFDFQTMMSGEHYDLPGSGMWTAMNMSSVLDFVIVNEISKNVDAYRLSAYLYKDRYDRDPRIHVGPVWDFNLAFGNASYHTAYSPRDWQIEYFMYNDMFNNGGDSFMMPFWWGEIWTSPRFQNKLYERWWQVRHTVLDVDRLLNYIDDTAALLDEAQQRNFERWPVLGRYVWPNPYIGYTYQDEIDYLKSWLQDRMEWMDDHLHIDPAVVEHQSNIAAPQLALAPNYPNPFNASTTLPIYVSQPAEVHLGIYNVNGRRVRKLVQQFLSAGHYMFHWNARNDAGIDVPSGVYYARLSTDQFVESQKLIVLR